ncbi:MAG TPA: DUF3039 domain-containing protein [Janibacter terrae]|nr:DUF3039 domain-containing protein [Janibacter terrae]
MTQLTPAPGSQTIVDERTAMRLDEGDHERFSHYVAKNKLTEAMVMGTPVVALCGKVWVPSRNPDRFPVCPECKEIWETFRGNEGGGDNGGGEES